MPPTDLPKETRVCPFLSLPSLNRPPSLVEGAAKPAFTQCAGPNCMLWVPISNPLDGKIVGGQCALALIPAGLSQIATLAGTAIEGSRGKA